MNIHDRNQPRIVYTDSSDSIVKDETFPYLIGQRRIRQDGKEALDLVDFGQRCRGRENNAVIRDRPSRYAREFGDLLEGEAGGIVLWKKQINNLDNDLVKLVVRLRPAQQQLVSMRTLNQLSSSQDRRKYFPG